LPGQFGHPRSDGGVPGEGVQSVATFPVSKTILLQLGPFVECVPTQAHQVRDNSVRSCLSIDGPGKRNGFSRTAVARQGLKSGIAPQGGPP
jgi:hypothetical protein